MTQSVSNDVFHMLHIRWTWNCFCFLSFFYVEHKIQAEQHIENERAFWTVNSSEWGKKSRSLWTRTLPEKKINSNRPFIFAFCKEIHKFYVYKCAAGVIIRIYIIFSVEFFCINHSNRILHQYTLFPFNDTHSHNLQEPKNFWYK